MRWLSAGLLLWSLAARAGDVCPSAEPAPLLHPRAAMARVHAFQRLPRRMGVETLRLRDGFATTLVREGCETYAVTFDLGPLPAHPDATRLRAIARAYMQRLLRVEAKFWLAQRFLALQATGVMQGPRLHIEDGDASFDIGPADSEPDRLLIVFAQPL
jgi:hypothetical protein